MSELVKSTRGSVSKRQPKNAKSKKVELQAEAIAQESVDTVSGGDLVSDAVLVADVQLAAAANAYNQRMAENTQRLFAHMRATGQQTSQSIRSHLFEAYGVGEADIYSDETQLEVSEDAAAE